MFRLSYAAAVEVPAVFSQFGRASLEKKALTVVVDFGGALWCGGCGLTVRMRDGVSASAYPIGSQCVLDEKSPCNAYNIWMWFGREIELCP